MQSLVGVIACTHGDLHLSTNAGNGGAQFMGSVCRKAAFGRQHALDAFKQAVQCAHHGLHLGGHVRQCDRLQCLGLSLTH